MRLDGWQLLEAAAGLLACPEDLGRCACRWVLDEGGAWSVASAAVRRVARPVVISSLSLAAMLRHSVWRALHAANASRAKGGPLVADGS
jgi:hypothetical protein